MVVRHRQTHQHSRHALNYHLWGYAPFVSAVSDLKPAMFPYPVTGLF